jgi:hypothetical protein
MKSIKRSVGAISVAARGCCWSWFEGPGSAAVVITNDHIGARHEACGIGRQENCRAYYFLNPSEPPHWCSQEKFILSWSAIQDALVGRGRKYPRAKAR